MGVYGNMVITKRGQTLFGKVQTGATLTFTRMQIGSGQLARGQDPTTFTSLIAPIDYFNINSVANSGGTAVVRGIYQNTNLTVSTYTCEIGLYAQDPDAGEILYAYANAGTQGDTIPPYSDGPYSRQFQINTAVGNATNVTANVPSDAYVTVSEVGQPGGVASLDNNGHVPPDQINISTATTTDPGTVLVSAPPTQGQQPVAVSTTDGAYKAISGGTYVRAGTGIKTTPGTNTETVSLAETGTPGTYLKVTTDAYGRVISGSALSAIDVADALGYQIQAGWLYNSNGFTSPGTVTFPGAFNSVPTVVICGGDRLSDPYISYGNVTTTNFQWASDYEVTFLQWIAIGK